MIVPEFEIKECPWCRCPGALHFDSLDKGNGRGYPGCFEVYVKCANDSCGAIAPHGKTDTVYRSMEEAIKKAIDTWNKRA